MVSGTQFAGFKLYLVRLMMPIIDFGGIKTQYFPYFFSSFNEDYEQDEIS